MKRFNKQVILISIAALVLICASLGFRTTVDSVCQWQWSAGSNEWLVGQSRNLNAYVGSYDPNVDQDSVKRGTTTPRCAATANAVQYSFRLENITADKGVSITGQKCILWPGQELKVQVGTKWYAVGMLSGFQLNRSATINFYERPIESTAPQCIYERGAS